MRYEFTLHISSAVSPGFSKPITLLPC